MKRKSIFNLFFSAGIVLLPFLYQYASPLSFLSMGDFIIAILTMIGLFRINFVKSSRKMFPVIFVSVSFVVLTFFSIPSMHFSVSDAGTSFLKIIMYLAVIAVAIECFEFSSIKNLYFFLVCFFAIYLFVQVLYNAATGNYLPICINYSWLFSWEQRPQDLHYYYTNVYTYYRPSSLFLEPGYYAFFVLPAIFILVLSKRNLIWGALLYLSVVLSTSGAGILFGLVPWIIFLFSNTFHIKNSTLFVNKNYIVIFIIICLIGVFVLLTNLNLMPRLFNSFNARVTRNYIINDSIDTFHQIFGVGMNNVECYMNSNSISTIFDEDNLNQGASAVTVLLQYGIMGVGIFIIFILLLFKGNIKKRECFAFICLFVAYTLFDEVLFNYKMGFLFSFIFYFWNVSESKHRASRISQSCVKATEAKVTL